ncbi:MAG: SPOR domain-containing protein [Methylovulum sp.]|nr:SPOR domain-containing protein [Methylovulum sp.]MCF7998020.1 SPOR domain-containing protein [Methylovulum sp.]
MVESDTFTYSIKKTAQFNAKSSEQFLITPERSQKLDLLIHLLANLSETLVICGPQGIGKTTLINSLNVRKMEAWTCCLIEGNADLSFEAINNQVNQALRLDKRVSQAQVFSQYQKHNKKIVLLIDDAGQLVPGLITTLIQYAWSNPVLRVVLVLTQDELHVKSSSDEVIDECYFIEIPPLTERQCGDFLLQLSAKSWARLPLKAVNESLIHTVYRQTHGIPGKIIKEIGNLTKPRKMIGSLWLLLFAVAGLVAIAFGVQWYSFRQPILENPSANVQQHVVSKAKETSALPALADVPTSPVEQPVHASDLLINQYIPKAPMPDPVAPLPPPPVVVTPEPEPVRPSVAVKATVATTKPAVESKAKPKPIKPVLAAVSPQVIKPLETIPSLPTPTQAQAVSEPPVSEAENPTTTWLNTQPVGTYTLQVMLLSNESAVKGIINKYPELAPDLRYVRTITRGKEKFLLLYGSFGDSQAAKSAKSTLPREFSRSLVKKLASFKK